MDHVAPEKRSRIMAAVKSKNTTPELSIRHALHRRGFRYALYAPDLPGKPDLVFRSRKKIVFIHGCFWHGHRCGKGRRPKTNRRFWNDKVKYNKALDARVTRQLRRGGWSVLAVWQCQTKNMDRLVEKIARFLESR
ncbi:MAG: very short patch repair endonuclease [Hyphomicrobiales bacterium]